MLLLIFLVENLSLALVTGLRVRFNICYCFFNLFTYFFLNVFNYSFALNILLSYVLS